MSNVFYPHGKQGFAAGEIDWDTAVIKVSLISGYTYSSSHKFVSDATGAGATLRATQTLASKTTTGGVMDAADVVFPSVASGASITALLVYQASAVTGGADVAAGSQRLIAVFDTMTGLPVTPNGGDLNLTLDAGGLIAL